MNIERILMGDDVVSAIRDNMDYLLEIIPEINNMIGFEHKHPHHHLDVWNHTLLALSLSNKDIDVRLALLLHDIGKPFSYQDGDIRHFKNHPKVSEELSRKILTRLGYQEEYINKICYLIYYHDTPISIEQINGDRELILKLYEVQRCDALAHDPNHLEKRKEYLERTKLLLYK